MITVMPRPDISVDPELMARLKAVAPATFGHLRTFGFVDNAIAPIMGRSRIRILGHAVTVRSYGQDSAVVHAAIDYCKPGDVLVIDRGGDTRTACWGEMTSLAAKYKGIAAALIDGAATDVAEIVDMGFPVYARAIGALTSVSKGEVGEINTLVQCGGIPVRPGDLVLADENGIVVLAPESVAEALVDAEPRQKREEWVRAELARGRALSDISGAGAKVAKWVTGQNG